MTAPSPGRPDGRLRLTDPLYAEVWEWLMDEAELLDGNHYEAWLARVSPDVRYRMPVRATVHASDGDGLSTGYSHLDESHQSLELRVVRITEGSAWSEIPPSRTRRFVSNLRVRSGGTEAAEAWSYLLLMRSRGDAQDYETLTCERQDTFHRNGDGDLLLASREIIVDQSSLGVTNLSVFL